MERRRQRPSRAKRGDSQVKSGGGTANPALKTPPRQRDRSAPVMVTVADRARDRAGQVRSGLGRGAHLTCQTQAQVTM